MLKFSPQMEEKMAQGYRHAGVAILCRVRETPEDFVPQEGSEDISLNKAMRLMLMGGHQLH